MDHVAALGSLLFPSFSLIHFLVSCSSSTVHLDLSSACRLPFVPPCSSSSRLSTSPSMPRVCRWVHTHQDFLIPAWLLVEGPVCSLCLALLGLNWLPKMRGHTWRPLPRLPPQLQTTTEVLQPPPGWLKAERVNVAFTSEPEMTVQRFFSKP